MLTADTVKLTQDLNDPFRKYSQQGQSALAASLGKIRGQFAQGQQATGRAQIGSMDYFNPQTTQAQNMAVRGVNDKLYGVLGNTSYKDQLAERNHQQALALARRYGDMMKPSGTQEAMGYGMQALGTAGSLYANGAFKGLGGKPKSGAYMPNSKLNLWGSMDGSGMGGY